jgi:uncharacterized phage protein (TIGR02220 family)/predicted phage replisome organizer
MAEKRYYWLKLKENYFDSPKIKKLRKIAGGDTYTIIYLKMQLLSVSNQGLIQYEGIEPTFEEEIALKLDEDFENVKVTLSYLLSQGLVESNNDQYLLVEANNSIGSEGQSAERKRQFDKRKAEKALLCNASVTQEKRDSISISNSLSNSISIEEENKKEEDKKVKEKIPYTEIINYLNEKTGKKYRATSKETQRHIKARINEGFTLDDFKRVIDIKCDKWKSDPKMQDYLRPETLFGNKFEGYLNETPKVEEYKTPSRIEADEQTKQQESEAFLEKLREANGYLFVD